jgi:GNAT superfamily N-acetyltransferase
MPIDVQTVDLEAIRSLREQYRAEMGCQIIFDSIHGRPGWTREYLIRRDGVVAGYGSVAIAGPWAERHTVYEFYLVPEHRTHVFDLFGVLREATGAPGISIQSNDALGSVVLHAFARDVCADTMIFHDRVTTRHAAPPNAVFRTASAAESPDAAPDGLRWRGIVEVSGEVAATGGVLFHYNPPYGDIYMDVDERFRRRGLGTYIVQELKRRCYEAGHIPAARCNAVNLASRQTLQRAGFVPCGYILDATLR